MVYAGTGQARNLHHVIKQSPLIEVFRAVHTTVQEHFYLLHRSTRHAPKDLTNTLQTLCAILEHERAHDKTVLPQRGDIKHIQNYLKEGMKRMQNTVGMDDEVDTLADDDGNMFNDELDLDDLEI